MKRLLSLIAFCCILLSANAIKVYINPGHGSWGPNCRPMATINYAAGDTLGFFESNTNLWKSFALESKLLNAGFQVKMSRRASGGSGTNEYNKALSTICAEAENYGADYYISIHSNAGPEGEIDGGSGKFANYPVILYRGYTGNPKVKKSDAMAKASIARLYEVFWTTPANSGGTGKDGGPEFTTYYSPSNPDILGDLSFYNTTSTYGYLGALKHEIPGFLSEGYFHTYSPARHRALNPEWCRQEGIRYFRGIMDYYGKTGESVGYIMGYVRSKTEKFTHTYYVPYKNSNDIYKPINGAKIVLRNEANQVIKTNCYNYVKRMLTDQDYYTTDHNYNGIFVFENLAPGKYTMSVHASGYKDYVGTVIVTADKTTYPEIFLEKGQGTEPNINTDIKWVLNGGIVPGGDVPTNAELWEEFMNGFNSYYTGYTNESGTFKTRTTRPITEVLEFTWTNIGALGLDFMTDSNSPWKWLGDYILSVASAQGISITTDSEWRQQFYAFFNCTNVSKKADGSVVGSTADFTQAGQPEAWGKAYQIAMGTSATLPTSVTQTYTLPTPQKEGDVFVGWYNNPRGDGSKIISIPAGYKGTIYAIWQYDNPDSDAELNIVTWVLNGGVVPGGEVPTNAELWETFKPYYNSYYGLNRYDQTIENVATFASAYMQDIMTNTKSEYKWLGDYILSVAGALDGESTWRWHVHAFFNCNDGTVQGNQKVATADFSQAGKPEAWGDAYRIAYGLTSELPTTITASYTLPTPVREGYIFVGWFDNPDGTGTPLTVLPKGYVGTVYAIWKNEVGSSVENISTPLDMSAPMYDILGRPVDKHYRGIVIQNGQTYMLQ